jgi:hypothetical protein
MRRMRLRLWEEYVSVVAGPGPPFCLAAGRGAERQMAQPIIALCQMRPYWRYPEAFIGSCWIWTISLVFDNTVLLRKTVQ